MEDVDEDGLCSEFLPLVEFLSEQLRGRREQALHSEKN